MTRILVVDDHPLVREAIADLLSDTEDLLVIGQCSDGSEVAEAVAALRPDVVVMDVSMPAMSGIEATRRLRDAQPDVRVLLVSAQTHSRSREDARRAGAAGYCDKSVRAEDLLQAVRNVAAGGTAWPADGVAV